VKVTALDMLRASDQPYDRPGWVRRFSKTHSLYYLTHKVTGKSTWEQNATESELATLEVVGVPAVKRQVVVALDASTVVGVLPQNTSSAKSATKRKTPSATSSDLWTEVETQSRRILAELNSMRDVLDMMDDEATTKQQDDQTPVSDERRIRWKQTTKTVSPGLPGFVKAAVTSTLATVPHVVRDKRTTKIVADTTEPHQVRIKQTTKTVNPTQKKIVGPDCGEISPLRAPGVHIDVAARKNKLGSKVKKQGLRPVSASAAAMAKNKRNDNHSVSKSDDESSEMPLNDNVDNTSSEEDDADDATFVLSVRREHTRVSKHDRTKEDTLVSTPQQRTETARKMQLMRRELATTNTFVQQMDYKA